MKDLDAGRPVPIAPSDPQDSARLRRRLDKIRRIFNIETLIRSDADEDEIVAYYTESDLGYRVLHSPEGAIHMALNPDGKFDRSGYYGQAKIVQKEIDATHAQAVLELGSGNGFNSIFLARNNPNVQFRGIDLTPRHVRTSIKKGAPLGNLEFRLGNFQELPYEDGSFGLVFVVESLCHASDMKRALEESRRVLAPGGKLIVIDGFRRTGFGDLSKDLRLASRLAEAAMAVDRPFEIDAWLQLVREVGYQVDEVQDLTPAILPNLLRFEFLARGFFKYRPLSRVILALFPQDFTRNAIAGLLMPLTTTQGAQRYIAATLSVP